MQYIYTTSIFFDTNNVQGVNTANEAANTTDFETNFKSQTYKINEFTPLDTFVGVEKTYSQFKTLVDGATILWSDVKTYTNSNHYDLYIITDAQL